MTNRTTEEIITSKKTLEDGSYHSRITKIRTYLSNMNPVVKKCLIGYGLISIGCYTVYNYNDGKNALKEYRLKSKDLNTKYVSDPEWEYKAVRNGINSYENFWSALFFPWSITRKIMPTIIILTHPSPAPSSPTPSAPLPKI